MSALIQKILTDSSARTDGKAEKIALSAQPMEVWA